MLSDSYFRVLVNLLLVSLLSGCAGSKYISEFEGNIEDIATIKGNSPPNPTYWGARETGIIRINGSRFIKSADDGFVLMPGDVSVVVGIVWGDPLDVTEDILAALVGYRGKQRIGNKLFTFTAEKGNNYVARAYNHDGGVLGKGGIEYVWIENDLTGDVVVGEKPPGIQPAKE